MLKPFTCKSCGAANQYSQICEYCGAASPIIESKAPPPLPQNNNYNYQSSDERYIRVLGTGYVCSDCGRYTDTALNKMPGYTFVEIFLYFLYIWPGIIYSIWRRNKSNWKNICPECNSSKMIPVTSSEGVLLFQRKYNRKPKFD